MAWIKIDLHTHSADSNITGSNAQKYTDLEIFDVLIKNHVAVASIADHDYFYKDSFIKRRELLANKKWNLVLFPGVEVDLKTHNPKAKTQNEKGQAVFIFNPDSDLDKLEQVIKNNFSKYRTPMIVHTYKEALEILKEFDFMVFPHTGKGQDNMHWEDFEDARVDAYDTTDLKSSNLKSIRKKEKELAREEVPVVVFSDTHTWRKYPEHSKHNTYVEADATYESVKMAIKNKKIYIEERK
ncbi:Uncharacterised protein [Mycoplasmopsis californica]|uniref:Polymerase/histidinol phosphatase N-terminal domain-containing protein n=1 Tax=Mycoplasmopsis equigenitalium TaxID=114883 RepID=A0ABY5J0U9_9BACT|nr:hypothetical protein [Mycoplasmopsis equigenitalium]UUD36887.1 hypothetical protein NPA09_03245 [Mycoplasmopsis equigenitalium]VEU69818.1 Uncharacterised protein [Mycoplasmopsis californica]